MENAPEKKKPTVRVVHPPVTPNAASRVDGNKVRRADPCVRAEAEDDDGYDPYSDRQEVRPLFERDPWD